MVILEGQHMGLLYCLLLSGLGKGFLQTVKVLEKDPVSIMFMCFL